MSIRRGPDGAYLLIRDNEESVTKLNEKYFRERDGWYPHTAGLPKINSLLNKHVGGTLQIVGKGPSLDLLTPENFDPSPILCLNDSIKVIDRLDENLADYVLQGDGGLNERCQPKKALLLLNWSARGWYERYPRRMVFDPTEDFSTGLGQLSAIYAMYFAKLFGCAGVRMLAFDACTDRVTSYASSLGSVAKLDSERNAGDRFLTHKVRLESVARSLALKLEWVRISKS